MSSHRTTSPCCCISKSVNGLPRLSHTGLTTSGRAKPCVIEQPNVCSVVIRLFTVRNGSYRLKIGSAVFLKTQNRGGVVILGQEEKVYVYQQYGQYDHDINV